MPCWYQLTTQFDLRPEVPGDEAFTKLVRDLKVYVGDNGHIEVTREATPQFIANMSGTFTISGPFTIDALIVKIGEYAVAGAVVKTQGGDEDEIYFVGISEAVRRQAEIAYHLEVIREHVGALQIEEDPMYDEGPLPVDDVVNAIRALVENRNTLVVGSYPEESRLDVSFVIAGSGRLDALELIDDIQNDLDDVNDIAACYPETIASNVFTAAAYYTARDLFNLAARLLQDPDVRRKSSVT